VAQWARQVAAAASVYADAAGLPPLELALDVAGIISRETGGQNILGDNGHGHGLMQIDDRFHGPWLVANQNGLVPASNIEQGTMIYLDGLHVIANHEQAAGRATETGKVRRAAMAAYNAGVHRVLEALDAGRDPDEHTTGGDYGKDVWRRREEFAAQLGAGGVCA
jgi:hypothetical protein